MEILGNFGFEPTFFFAQIINFLILAFIFQRFLYKPVLKVLADRKKTIEKGLRDAEAASATLEKANEERDEIINNATLQAEKIIEETAKAADELKEASINSAAKEADKIIAQAVETAEIEFKKAQSNAQDIALQLSKNIVDKILSEIFTREEKTKILERNAKKLIKSGHQNKYD